MNFNICKINGFNDKKSKNIERKSKKNQPEKANRAKGYGLIPPYLVIPKAA